MAYNVFGLKNLPRFSVEHPIIMITIFIALIGGGFLVYQRLPVELQPYVDSPTIGVVIQYPGVAAEDMEVYFARPIEQKMTVIKDIEWIRSNAQEGRAEIIMGFPYFSDVNKHKLEVQTLLTNLLNELPLDKDNTTNPWVVHVDAQNVPILDLYITHDSWDDVRLREFVANEMRERFELIPGVQSAIPFGGKRRQVTVQVDRDKLGAYKLGLMDIKRGVERQHLSRSAGRLISPQQDILIRADERFRNPEEMADIPIGSLQDRIVYLRDVAEVKDAFAEVRSAYHFNGKRGLLLTIVKQPEVGDPQAIEPSLKLAEEFKKNYPGLKIETAYNRINFIHKIIQNSWWELFLAFAINAVVIIAFLNSITPTLIILVTLPAAVLASFLLWLPWGLTVNTPTNMALVFVLGRLVDDAAVYTYVIHQHLKMGKTPKQAAIDGAEELVFATLATSFSFWLVLSPNLFLKGAMGIGFRGMTAPMIFANIFSTLFAITMNPLMAAYMYRPYKERATNPLDRLLAWLFRPFNWFIDRLEGFYGGAVSWSLNHRAVVVVFIIMSVYIGWQTWPMLGWEGMPLQDTGQAVGEVEAWPGTPFGETEKITSKVEEILMQQPEVKLVSTQIGQEPVFGTYFSGYGMRTVNKAFFKVTLTDTDERICQFYNRWADKFWPLTLFFEPCSKRSGRDIWTILDTVQNEAIETIPGIRSLWLMEMGATPVNNARAPVEVTFKGDNLETLAKIGDRALEIAKRAPGVVQPFISWSLTMPQYHLEIDRRRAQELGLAVPEIAMQAFYAHQGGMTAEFFKPEDAARPYRHHRILIRYRPDQRMTKEDLEQTLITTMDGRQIPLKEVARIREKRGTDWVYKEDLQYAMSVLAQYRGLGLKMATAGIIMGAKTSIDLPRGYTVQPTGMMLTMLDNIYRLYDALVVSVFFIFITLLFQTNSFVTTSAIMLSIPERFTGAILFLYFRGFFWSPPVLWGQLIATGMVTADAIYLLDKIVQLREGGMERREACIQGCRFRFRAVLITTITTIVSFIPPMLAPPTGMDRFKPIVTGIVGAMVSSTLLTLISAPVSYTLLDDLREFLRKVYGAAPKALPTFTTPAGIPAGIMAEGREEEFEGARIGGGSGDDHSGMPQPGSLKNDPETQRKEEDKF